MAPLGLGVGYLHCPQDKLNKHSKSKWGRIEVLAAYAAVKHDPKAQSVCENVRIYRGEGEISSRNNYRLVQFRDVRGTQIE